MDIFGDHYFQCLLQSKIWLHNRMKDTLYQYLCTIGFIGGLITSSSDVTFEPSGASKTFVRVCPLDVATEGAAEIIDINVNIAPNPNIKPTPLSQIAESTDNPLCLEVRKWRGTSQPDQTNPIPPSQDNTSQGDTPLPPLPPPVFPAKAAVQ
eukprot:8924320-Ditylum_brightwellii.AAC.1